jgi:methylmalonyl-CoA/ethylmalonyl-CoA epimerase
MFKKIDHIGIAVNNIEEAASLFDKVFGLKIAKQEIIEDQDLIAALIPTNNVRFELMQPTKPDSVIGRFIEKKGQGIHHICFEVENIIEEIEALQNRDVNVIQGHPREGFVGDVEFIHPKSANGVLTEIAQVTLRTPVNIDLGVHHITIATKDRDAAVDNWINKFGLKLNKLAERQDAPIITGWLDAGNAEVEFAQQTSEDGPLAKSIASRGEGIYGIVLETSDAVALKNHIVSQGLRVIEDKEGENYLRVIHPSDFLGTLMIFNQKD